MGSKASLICFKVFLATVLIGFPVVLSGCGSIAVKSASPAFKGIPQNADGGAKDAENQQLSPRALAALQLTEQGRMFIKNKQPDDAIGMLERALNLNPDNGRNYYYLAEAWLMKGNIGQASQFNRLAQMYLKDDREWRQRVILQREQINKKSH